MNVGLWPAFVCQGHCPWLVSAGQRRRKGPQGFIFICLGNTLRVIPGYTLVTPGQPSELGVLFKSRVTEAQRGSTKCPKQNTQQTVDKLKPWQSDPQSPRSARTSPGGPWPLHQLSQPFLGPAQVRVFLQSLLTQDPTLESAI